MGSGAALPVGAGLAVARLVGLYLGLDFLRMGGQLCVVILGIDALIGIGQFHLDILHPLLRQLAEAVLGIGGPSLVGIGIQPAG